MKNVLKMAGAGAVLMTVLGGHAVAAEEHPAIKRPFDLPPSADLTYSIGARQRGFNLSGDATLTWRANDSKYTVSAESGGIRSLSSMIASSINCAFVRLGLIVGLDKVVDVAHRMGVTSDLDPVPSISLGAEEVSPLDMASAYGVLADNGVRHAPYYIDHIVDRDGKVIYQHQDAGSQVIDPGIAATATKMLQGVVTSGTGIPCACQSRCSAADSSFVTATCSASVFECFAASA